MKTIFIIMKYIVIFVAAYIMYGLLIKFLADFTGIGALNSVSVMLYYFIMPIFIFILFGFMLRELKDGDREELAMMRYANK